MDLAEELASCSVIAGCAAVAMIAILVLVRNVPVAWRYFFSALASIRRRTRSRSATWKT